VGRRENARRKFYHLVEQLLDAAISTFEDRLGIFPASSLGQLRELVAGA
jgi:hypothetical protein